MHDMIRLRLRHQVSCLNATRKCRTHFMLFDQCQHSASLDCWHKKFLCLRHSTQKYFAELIVTTLRFFCYKVIKFVVTCRNIVATWHKVCHTCEKIFTMCVTLWKIFHTVLQHYKTFCNNVWHVSDMSNMCARMFHDTLRMPKDVWQFSTYVWQVLGVAMRHPKQPKLANFGQNCQILAKTAKKVPKTAKKWGYILNIILIGRWLSMSKKRYKRPHMSGWNGVPWLQSRYCRPGQLRCKMKNSLF